MRGHEGGGPGGECGAEKNCELGGGGGCREKGVINTKILFLKIVKMLRGT